MLSTLMRNATSAGIRTRAVGVTAGIVASAALMSGAGMATGDSSVTAGSGDVTAEETFTSRWATEHSEFTREQADRSYEAAQEEAAEAKRAEEAAEKKAAEKRAAEKKKSSWVAPIEDGYSLTATYGNSGDRWASSHSGQDFAVPTGTPVQAVHGGTVVKAGGNGGGDGPAYGNAVVIEHPDGTYSQYAHLDQVKVSPGESVKTGDRIALSGNTGNSSGPHLHFEIRTAPDFGTSVDPMAHLRGQGVEV
ncbi:M23 family metallopeptidase [Streptomyces sodiiphilus]